MDAGDRIKAWADQPRIQALSEEERVQAAVEELGMRAIVCRNCEGIGCELCGYEGDVIIINEVQ